MQCFVYKSDKHFDMYLYIATQDDFSQIPDALLERFGTPFFVLDFDINQRQQLGRESLATVKHNLTTQGFHLQLPENPCSITTPEPPGQH